MGDPRILSRRISSAQWDALAGSYGVPRDLLVRMDDDELCELTGLSWDDLFDDLFYDEHIEQDFPDDDWPDAWDTAVAMLDAPAPPPPPPTALPSWVPSSIARPKPKAQSKPPRWTPPKSKTIPHHFEVVI